MESNIKNDLVDVLRRSSAVSDSRIADLRMEIQKQIEGKLRIETKLEEASREPGKRTGDAFLRSCNLCFLIFTFMFNI